MNARAKAFPLSAHWDITLKNTAYSPWQRARLCDNEIELRWIDPNSRSGQFLMLVDQATGPKAADGPGYDGFWTSGPGKSVLSQSSRNSRQASRLWIGLPRDSREIVQSDIETWHAKLKADPVSGAKLRARLSRITVIIGPSIPEVTGGMGQEEACMVPRVEDGRLIAFIVMINHPQPRMTRLQEQEWLRCALAHELEHVWQFLAASDSKFELPWATVSEMCAVYAEHRDHPRATAYLSFGPEYLRRLPDGLLTGSAVGEIERPYWWFPLIQHLEQCRAEIHRELWTRKCDLSKERVERGPWLFVDELLRERDSSLVREWIRFCQLAVRPASSQVADAIRDRYPARLPTIAVDLTAVSREEGYRAEWEFRVLSGHWIRVLLDPGSTWKLEWEVEQSMQDAEFSISTCTSRHQWREVLHQRGDHRGSLALEGPGPQATQDILFVHAFAPDMSRLYDRVGEGRVQSLDPAWLTVRFARLAAT